MCVCVCVCTEARIRLQVGHFQSIQELYRELESHCYACWKSLEEANQVSNTADTSTQYTRACHAPPACFRVRERAFGQQVGIAMCTHACDASFVRSGVEASKLQTNGRSRRCALRLSDTCGCMLVYCRCVTVCVVACVLYGLVGQPKTVFDAVSVCMIVSYDCDMTQLRISTCEVCL